MGGGISKIVEMGGWPRKYVGVGRLAPKTDGRWEVEVPATPHY